ncbi:MAG: GNAT family N-acetyltransferase [Gammaproteobacteria bacterium]|nr:GNAT family N-acetyltransferase [Gammaproteobacteria bacterium]
METARLNIFPCSEEHFAALLNSPGKFESAFGYKVVDEYSAFPEAIAFGYERLLKQPDILNWWTYLFVHKNDKALIGVGGYKGPPTVNREVEIGYSIAPSYSGRGFATEAAAALCKHAQKTGQVRCISAHTLNGHNASTRILEKCGFRRVAEIEDSEDGVIWRWENRFN